MHFLNFAGVFHMSIIIIYRFEVLKFSSHLVFIDY